MMRLNKFALFMLILLSGRAFAKEQYCNRAPISNNGSALYPNGQVVRDYNGYFHYPDGSVIKDYKGTSYYPNRQVVRDYMGYQHYPNGTLVRNYTGSVSYPNAQVFRDYKGTCYHENGTPIGTCPKSSQVQVRDSGLTLASLEIQLDHPDALLPIATFEDHYADGSSLFFEVNLASGEVSNIRLICNATLIPRL